MSLVVPCYADRNMYRKVEQELVHLMTRIRKTVDNLPRQKRRQYYDAFHDIWKEAKTLYDQLYTWGEDEEICYDEFWSRIEKLKSRFYQLKMKVEADDA